jgi:putative two-component system response regulator
VRGVSAPKSTILAVDDAEDVRKAVQAALGKFHVVKAAPDARSALRLALEAPRPDLVLLDADLGGTSGYDVCKAMRATPALAELPVIVLSDAGKPSDIAQGYRYGAIDCLTKPLAPAAVLSRVETHLEHLARERVHRLDHSREQLVGRLARALELHSGWPGGNRAVRIAHYARVLAQAAGARDVACDLIMKAAPLYDVGKLGVPAEFLRKEALLQGTDRKQFQRHPAIGAEIIGESDDPLLKLARTLAVSYRERWDGSGYPSGLKGNDIPWGGRVMAIVSQFEALTSPPYHRAPLPVERAGAEILAEAGKQFDPTLVQALQKALPALRKVYETYADKQTADGDDEMIGGPASKGGESEADRTLIAPLALRGTPVSDEARTRAAGERAAAEDKAAQAARERRDLEQAAALAAEQRALAEEKLAKAAHERRRADEEAAKAAEKRITNEARAAGVDPKTQIALTRAQEMLAQLQKERTTLQAEFERLQTALGEREKQRSAAIAERDQALAELKRAQAAPPAPPPQNADADDIVIGEAPAASASAQLEPLKAALAEREKQLINVTAERDEALEQLKRAQAAPATAPAEDETAQAALAEKEKERAAADAERQAALVELKRLQAALAEKDQAHEKALAELKRMQAPRAAAKPAIIDDDDIVIGEAAPSRPGADDELVIGATVTDSAASAAALAEKEAQLAASAAELKRAQASLADERSARSAATAERDAARAEMQRLQAAAAENEKERRNAQAQAQAELARLRLALAEAQKQQARASELDQAQAALARAERERADALAGRERALAELKSVQAALAEAKRAAPEEIVVATPAPDPAPLQAALEEARQERASAEALRDEAVAELQRLEVTLAEANSHRQRAEAAVAQVRTDLAQAQEALGQARKQAAESRPATDDASAKTLAQAQKERAAAEDALAQAQAERRRAEEQARVQQDLTRANEEAGRRIAEELAQVRAERHKNEELLAQLQSKERGANEALASEEERMRLAAEREAAEARAEEAARRRREEDEAATRAAEERRDAEAATHSLPRQAPRAGRLAAVFGLGMLAAAAIAGALWLSGVLEPAPREVAAVPAVAAPAAPIAEPAAFLNGDRLQLRLDDTLPAR